MAKPVAEYVYFYFQNGNHNGTVRISMLVVQPKLSLKYLYSSQFKICVSNDAALDNDTDTRK